MVHVISFKLLYIVEETDVVDPPTMTTSLSGTARKKKWQILKKYIKQTSVCISFRTNITNALQNVILLII